jgi:uncharacterized protein (TIGR00661 family)
MKYFFIVQGEGMGHTTQSLAFRELLEKKGHEVVATFLGTNFKRTENILLQTVPHERFFSPIFLSRKDRQGIGLLKTFLYNLLLSPVYIYSILRIAYRIRTSEAETVVVFYDFVGQLGSFFSFSGKPVFSVSHHFFFGHPSFEWPSNRKVERNMLIFHSWLASLGARKKLALSFTLEVDIPRKKLFIVPPLLRNEILEAVPAKGDHILVYSLQPGFLKEIAILAIRFPEKNFRVFLHELPNKADLPENIKVYSVSGNLFQESIINCSMVICTAGFETLAESVFLNKSLLIVPSRGHFEQYCNSIDARRAGVAAVQESFEQWSPTFIADNPAHGQFVKFVSRTEEIIMEILSE